MQSTTDLAVHILAGTPARTLPLSQLSHLIEREVGWARVGHESVIQAVQARPNLFRLLNPWRGPWRGSGRTGSKGSTSTSSPLAGVADEPWVLLLEPPTDSELEPPLRMLQESMLAAGRRVDERSVTALARWLRMSLEVGDVASSLQRATVS